MKLDKKKKKNLQHFCGREKYCELCNKTKQLFYLDTSANKIHTKLLVTKKKLSRKQIPTPSPQKFKWVVPN